MRRPFGFVISDQQTRAWLPMEYKTSDGAHRAADKLNRAEREWRKKGKTR